MLLFCVNVYHQGLKTTHERLGRMLLMSSNELGIATHASTAGENSSRQRPSLQFIRFNPLAAAGGGRSFQRTVHPVLWMIVTRIHT